MMISPGDGDGFMLDSWESNHNLDRVLARGPDRPIASVKMAMSVVQWGGKEEKEEEKKKKLGAEIRT